MAYKNMEWNSGIARISDLVGHRRVANDKKFLPLFVSFALGMILRRWSTTGVESHVKYAELPMAQSLEKTSVRCLLSLCPR